MSTDVDIQECMADPTRKLSKFDRTRAAILAAASALFSRYGYERTTIRDIAARASIDPAMVIRYFRSKEELFALVAVFELRLPNLDTIPSSRVGETLVAIFLDRWEQQPDSAGWSVLLRSAASNEYAAGKVREVIAKQLVPAMTRLGGRAGADRRAGLAASQFLGLALCRYVLKVPQVVAMSPQEIVQDVGPTIQRYVVGRG